MDYERRENGDEFTTTVSEATPLNAPQIETQQTETPVVKRTFLENVKFFIQNVTIEPTVVLFFVGFMTVSLATTNLSLMKACRVNLNFTDEICTAMSEQKLESQNPYEREVQRLLTSVITWKTYITATIPAILGLFVGPWSDKTGHRKIFLVISVAGQVLNCVNGIIQVYFFDYLNLEALVFSEAVIEALSGGMCVTVITLFSFIAAITTTETRTFRMGMVNMSVSLGFPLGTSLSGVILSNLGYYGSYGIAMGVSVINILYNVFVLKDPERTSEQKKHDKRGFLHFLRTFFDLSNLRDAISVVFRDDGNRRRLRMCVLLVVVTFLFGPTFGEASVTYMMTRYRFNWNEFKYSLFQTYNFIISAVGTMFSFVVLSRYLSWHDALLGVISTTSKILASFVFCFAPNEQIFFIAPLVEILGGTAMLVTRSISSKLVEIHEIGKLNSIIGLTENLMPLVYVPLYTNVYTATMDVLPGAVFLLGAAMTVPALAFFVWHFTDYRLRLRKKPLEENGLELPSKEA